MKPARFHKTKSVMASSAIALVVAALVMGLTSFVLGPRSGSTQHLGFELTSGPSSFIITSAIYASPACSGTPALLYPGTPRCAVFNVHNDLSVPITVQNITGALDTSYPIPPSECSGTNLTLPNYSGSFNVPANGNAASPGVLIELNESGSNQDACQNLAYHFTYSGSAIYTDSTHTVLTSSASPSLFGQSVTVTATVTGDNAGLDTSKPRGTVTFYECSGAGVDCHPSGSVLAGPSTIDQSTGKVSFSTTALALGDHYLDAVYTPASADSTNYTTSFGTLTQTIGLPSRCDSSTHNGGYTVTSGESICLTGRVNGGLTVDSGGAVYLDDANVNGGITSTGATAVRICGTNLSGNISVSESSGFVMIGDGGDDGSPACAGNTSRANLSVTDNAGGFEVGGNTIGGTLTISGNTFNGNGGEGAAQVEANQIGGDLSCATSNDPALTNDGLANTVAGTTSGQCAGSGF